MQNFLYRLFFSLGAIFFFFLLGFFWAAFIGTGNLLNGLPYEGKFGEAMMGAFIGAGIGGAYVFGTFRYRKNIDNTFLQHQAMIFWGLCVLSMAAAIIGLRVFGLKGG